MSQYKNISVDFVERSIKKNMYLQENNVKLPQEVTHFLNYCYGLLILPKQNINDVLVLMPQELKYYGIESNNFKSTKAWTFEQFITSMRNALAHSHIQTYAETGTDNIKEVELSDYASENDAKTGSPHTQITLTLEEFEVFISRFSSEYLKAKEIINKQKQQKP